MDMDRRTLRHTPREAHINHIYSSASNPTQRVAAVLLATLASAAAFVPASFKAPAARTRGYVYMVWATRIKELRTARLGAPQHNTSSGLTP